MFLDYSGYEALTEINSSFGKYVLLLQQFESCRELKARLQLLQYLGKEFKIFEKLNVKDFKKSEGMVHRFYTMVISLKQIMEIGPLIRRSPAVLIVEFECPVKDCLDDLDPLHPLNKAYIFIHKQWTYYHRYYIVEKIKKVIINMAPTKEEDWSILHRIVYCDGFTERRYKKKKYLADIYIPQPLLKSNKITTISKFSQLSKFSNVRVYRFNTTAVGNPANLNKTNLKVQELNCKDFPNLVWTLEPEKFYVDMKPYKEHQRRKRQREEAAKIQLQLETQEKERKLLEETNEENCNELKGPSGLKNIMKTPLANKVANIFNSYTAVVTGNIQGITTEVNKENGNPSEMENGKLAEESRNQIQVSSETQIYNVCLQQEFPNNDGSNTSWNTTMRDIDPVHMNESCIRVWRKEQQMLGLEQAKTFERKLQRVGTLVDKRQFGGAVDNEGRIEFQRVTVGEKTASSASDYNKLSKNSHKEKTHGLMRKYLRVKFSISVKGRSNQSKKDDRKYSHKTKYEMSSLKNISNISQDTQISTSINLTDIRFKDMMAVKFRGFRARFAKFKINT
ncbi:YKR015C [Saccharomyces arboricola H-6]|uniref:YKR015C n=1 Tax=Saccharomyces arboricola (strain H-6 / AS 2.3317 / CBS 10644) TaxID=1160507 RepID=J8LLH6_SACAR|nr:YKR015C [Saccharomyces arboricola H-6]